MNRFVWIWVLCFSFPVTGMSQFLKSSVKIKPRSTQVSLNTHRNYGTTHFIVGHDYNKPSVSIPELKHPVFIEKPAIIDGSSAHLIDDSRQTQCFFTSIHDITSIILKLLEQAQEKINIAIYTLTDCRIADALIAAHKRGVNVCVIMDCGKMKERYSKSQKLINAGVSVRCYDPNLRSGYKKKDWSDPLMHHKCMNIDTLIITGSANSTKAAQLDNMENINILRDEQAVEEHRQEFERLKKLSVECKKATDVSA